MSSRNGRLDLQAVDPGSTDGYGEDGKKSAKKGLEKDLERLNELQQLLYAQGKHALLIVLQAMDTAGKDGTIRYALSSMNPQGVQVHPFKKPTHEEAAHDFLWRVHAVVPKKGMVGVFNRSHYEDILMPSVYDLLPKDRIEERYEQINAFERTLAGNGVAIIKFYLHISKEEQRERLQARLDDKSKHWKFDPADLDARKRWDKFMKVYGKILARTDTPWAPWHVIPANKKWYRNALVARLLRERLESLDLRYPEAPKNLEKTKIPA